MTANEWLVELARALRAECPDVEAVLGDEETLTLTRGRRSAFVQIAGDVALIAQSGSAGTTIADRLAQRSSKPAITSYSLTPDAAAAAAVAVAAHLRG